MAAFNFTNERLMDAEENSDVLLFSWRISDLYGYFSSYFRTFFVEMVVSSARKILSSISWMASLFYTINCIFLSCSQKKMIRFNALRVIAFVAYKHPFWNISERLFPRESVSKNKPAMSPRTHLESSISVLVGSRCPFPASRGFYDFRPEPFHVQGV